MVSDKELVHFLSKSYNGYHHDYIYWHVLLLNMTFIALWDLDLSCFSDLISWHSPCSLYFSPIGFCFCFLKAQYLLPSGHGNDLNDFCFIIQVEELLGVNWRRRGRLESMYMVELTESYWLEYEIKKWEDVSTVLRSVVWTIWSLDLTNHWDGESRRLVGGEHHEIMMTHQVWFACGTLRCSYPAGSWKSWVLNSGGRLEYELLPNKRLWWGLWLLIQLG